MLALLLLDFVFLLSFQLVLFCSPGWNLCLSSLSDEITGVNYHTWLAKMFNIDKIRVFLKSSKKVKLNIKYIHKLHDKLASSNFSGMAH